MIKASVIMPCYNVVLYFKECIESVLNQKDFEGLEVIIVDAGSSDGTYEIASYYADKHTNVRLISSDKKSYGYQVNLGIKEAKGEYVAVLETDDYIKEDMYISLYNLAKENDVEYVKADFDVFYQCRNGKRIIWNNTLNKQYENISGHGIDPSKNAFLYNTDTTIWRGIYLREFLIQNGVFLNETSGAAFQDIGFGLLLHAKARRALYVQDSFYRYRMYNWYRLI